MKEIRRKLTYANVMSSLAVFLVLGGATAVAAVHLGKNTVGTKQLKANAVTKTKIKKRSVTGVKIADGSITGIDIAPDSITGDQINADSLDSVPTADKLAGDFSMTFPLDSTRSVPDVPSPFYVFGSCNGIDERADLVVGSETTGSIYGNGIDFPQPFDPPKLALVTAEAGTHAAGEHPTVIKSQEGKFFAMSSLGLMIQIANVSVAVNVGSSRDCVINGNIQQLTSF
jgi:hypothetical protein